MINMTVQISLVYTDLVFFIYISNKSLAGSKDSLVFSCGKIFLISFLAGRVNDIPTKNVCLSVQCLPCVLTHVLFDWLKSKTALYSSFHTAVHYFLSLMQFYLPILAIIDSNNNYIFKSFFIGFSFSLFHVNIQFPKSSVIQHDFRCLYREPSGCGYWYCTLLWSLFLVCVSSSHQYCAVIPSFLCGIIW